MPHIQIRRHDNNQIIYEGSFQTARHCLEQAVKDRICLDYANISFANLQNANLDSMIMRHGNVSGANLTSANLSESDLEHTDFSHSRLIDCCLCETNLQYTNFTNAGFGGTDIAGTMWNHAVFSTISALLLPFRDAKTLENCVFSFAGINMEFSRPPVILGGLEWPVYMLDTHMGLGTMFKRYRDWFSIGNDNNNTADHAAFPDSAYKMRFIQMHRHTLVSLAASHCLHREEKENFAYKTAR